MSSKDQSKKDVLQHPASYLHNLRIQVSDRGSHSEGVEMTRDDILKKAEKYGSMIAGWCFNTSGLEKFWWEAYEAGAAAEREACAELCDEVGSRDSDSHAWDAAAAIRARGEK